MSQSATIFSIIFSGGFNMQKYVLQIGVKLYMNFLMITQKWADDRVLYFNAQLKNFMKIFYVRGVS